MSKMAKRVHCGFRRYRCNGGTMSMQKWARKAAREGDDDARQWLANKKDGNRR